MAKAITDSAPAGKDQEKVVNIIISVVSIMRICRRVPNKNSRLENSTIILPSNKYCSSVKSEYFEEWFIGIFQKLSTIM